MKTYIVLLLLTTASTISFGHNNGLIPPPPGIQPWPNNNGNIPPGFHNLLPIQPYLSTNQHIAPPETSLLAQFQSLQMMPPVTSTGLPMGGYGDPRGLLFAQPGNFNPFLPHIDHQMSQSFHHNHMYKDQIQMNVQHQEISSSLRGDSTSQNNMSFQINSQQNQCDRDSVLFSDQQAKADANLELAKKLTVKTNVIPNDLTLIDSSPRKNFSTCIEEFPALK